DSEDNVSAFSRLAVGLEGLGGHQWTKVGAADADVDDVGDRLAGVALPGAAANGLGEFAHVGEGGVYFRHNVFAIHENRPVRAVAQGNVQHGPIFSGIDLGAREHLFRRLL